MANTVRVPLSTSTAIQQRSSAIFDGTMPTGDSPIGTDYSIYKFALQSAGGLFFWNTVEPLVCSQIHLDMGAAANATISLVNLDPTSLATTPVPLSGETMIIEQATGVRYIALDESHFKTVLLPYQAIQIVTTSSGSNQIAQVVASLERSFVR